MPIDIFEFRSSTNSRKSPIIDMWQINGRVENLTPYFLSGTVLICLQDMNESYEKQYYRQRKLAS